MLDAADVRVPREVYLDNGEVVRQNLLEWLVFEGEMVVDMSPRRLARYMRMLIEDYGFALPADAGLATRAGVREALVLLAPAPAARSEL